MCAVASGSASESGCYVAVAGTTDEATAAGGRSSCLRSLKMAWLNDLYGGKFPIGLSLAIIGALIGGGMVLSLAIPQRHGAHESGSVLGGHP